MPADGDTVSVQQLQPQKALRLRAGLLHGHGHGHGRQRARRGGGTRRDRRRLGVAVRVALLALGGGLRPPAAALAQPSVIGAVQNATISTDSGRNDTLRAVFGASSYWQSGKLCHGWNPVGSRHNVLLGSCARGYCAASCRCAVFGADGKVPAWGRTTCNTSSAPHPATDGSTYSAVHPATARDGTLFFTARLPTPSPLQRVCYKAHVPSGVPGVTLKATLRSAAGGSARHVVLRELPSGWTTECLNATAALQGHTVVAVSIGTDCSLASGGGGGGNCSASDSLIVSEVAAYAPLGSRSRNARAPPPSRPVRGGRVPSGVVACQCTTHRVRSSCVRGGPRYAGPCYESYDIDLGANYALSALKLKWYSQNVARVGVEVRPWPTRAPSPHWQTRLYRRPCFKSRFRALMRSGTTCCAVFGTH